MDYYKKAIDLHAEWRGKLDFKPKMEITDRESLSTAYTPGVAAPCLAIQDDISKCYELTGRGNLVAVITDGSAVLGLGDIGPEAGLPVMEGKCVLFKTFAGINAVPLCIRTHDVDEIVRTVQLLAGSFGAINLADTSAPRCFEIERRLKEVCDIPVFHDDQHGAAVVVGAALINALKVTGKKLESIRCVISGAGAAGVAIAGHIASMGCKDIIVADSRGCICKGRENLSPYKQAIAEFTNHGNICGSIANALKGADVFIGVSMPGTVTAEMISTMAKNAIVLAMANPVPEIMPDEAARGGAMIIGTGRSDFPNQINNVLAFPGIFRGALDARASDINEEMKMAASYAIAALVSEEELSKDHIIPNAFDMRVGPAVAKAVEEAARRSGAARN